MEFDTYYEQHGSVETPAYCGQESGVVVRRAGCRTPSSHNVVFRPGHRSGPKTRCSCSGRASACDTGASTTRPECSLRGTTSPTAPAHRRPAYIRRQRRAGHWQFTEIFVKFKSRFWKFLRKILKREVQCYTTCTTSCVTTEWCEVLAYVWHLGLLITLD